MFPQDACTLKLTKSVFRVSGMTSALRSTFKELGAAVTAECWLESHSFLQTMDPAHVPWAHHGLRVHIGGDRNKVSPLAGHACSSAWIVFNALLLNAYMLKATLYSLLQGCPPLPPIACRHAWTIESLSHCRHPKLT